MQQIAGKLTIKDWEELANKLDISKTENWGSAFNFYEQRITTRYLNPINAILNMDLNTGEGFAVVNLQCSLIETIECFYNGWIYKYPDFFTINRSDSFRGNKKIFECFFKKREPFKCLNIDGEDFYYNVRCGLLHETQTKRGWIIKAESDKIYELKEGQKIIYRTNFQKAIEDVIKQYKSDLINSREAENLRTNLKGKFNNICLESKAK